MYKRIAILAAVTLLTLLATPLRAYAVCGGALQPTCPTTVTLSGTAGNGQNSLNWTTSNGSGSISYTLRRGTSIVYVGQPTVFTDTGLTNGQAYSYYVVASDSNGNSPNSNTVSLTPTAPASSPPPTYPIPAFSDGSQITYRDINLMAIYITGVIVLILVNGFKWRGND